MTFQSKNKVVLSCPEGPCSGDGSIVTTDLLVEVREKGVNAQAPLDPAAIRVTLTHIATLQARSPGEVSLGKAGQILARFASVPQGWHRALAVRLGPGGKIEASAARRVQAIRTETDGGEAVQRVILILSEQGVAKFAFVSDTDEAPLQNMNVIVRHPDGSEQRHTTDGLGELKLAGGTGEVFTVLRIEHATTPLGITSSKSES
jgi:hypothetical protein